MKTVLCTTTIYVPEVLKRYRELGPDVSMIVAGDTKEAPGVRTFCEGIGARFIGAGEQSRLYPELSTTIGWNNVQRRNIAILEAAKLEPDVIVSVDDDNLPALGGDYFADIERAFSTPQRGFVAEGEWFNLGELASERFTCRGYPHRFMDGEAGWSVNGHTPYEVGILNGLIFGDPDVTARERIDIDPKVSYYDAVAQRGITVDPAKTWTPVNAQNTAYRGELAPLMLQLPHVGRYDDIWGSYIAQRVLADTGLHVHFGRPFVKQRRHAHDLERDLADEAYGDTWTLHLAGYLRALQVPEGTVLERLRFVLSALADSGLELPLPFFYEWLAAFERLKA